MDVIDRYSDDYNLTFKWVNYVYAQAFLVITSTDWLSKCYISMISSGKGAEAFESDL